MSVKASLVGWPVGVDRESVAEPIRITMEFPGAMFPNPTDKEMVEAIATFRRRIAAMVRERSGVELQWVAVDGNGRPIERRIS